VRARGARSVERVDDASPARQKFRKLQLYTIPRTRLRTSAGESETRAKGSVVASDAFFPFADGLLAAAEADGDAVLPPQAAAASTSTAASAPRRRNLVVSFIGPPYGIRGHTICAT
jgi:phosphoribosylaminoimidazolecarboxamide formyltransferase/IMP cyclohydrolase